jgi:proteasome lid subunit RPN8/RPN11
MLEITPQCREDMFEHATSETPNECCGLVLGEQYVPCLNIADDPASSFRIAPEVMAEAYAGGELRAVIHSHPEGPACPTKTDMEYQAAGDVPWGVVEITEVYGPRVFFWGDTLPIAPYEGRVFRHGVADCYALVRDWYRQERSVVLPVTPRDPEWWDLGQSVIEDNLSRFDFDEFDLGAELQIDDVLLFRIGAKIINHTGIYVGNGLVLHHLTRRLSRIDVLGPWREKYLVKGMRQRAALQSIGEAAA